MSGIKKADRDDMLLIVFIYLFLTCRTGKYILRRDMFRYTRYLKVVNFI